jgi:para-aminobenzoate synthetase
MNLYHKKIPLWHDPENIFTALFAEEAYSFWLDSNHETARFSYMGIPAKRIAYSIEKKVHTNIFDYLEKELNHWKDIQADLPFDFVGGFVGYFGYELQAECGGKQYHTSAFPDAYFFFVDRFIAFDHKEKKVYLVCLSESEKEAKEWFEKIELHSKVKQIKNKHVGAKYFLPLFAKSHDQYLDDVKKCQEYLKSGNAYQICLTNQITADVQTDLPVGRQGWFALYKMLRKINPAPYSAYLRFNDFAILSSSPEMFLKVDKDRMITSKPIKGTVRRGKTRGEDQLLAEQLGKNEKDFAENAMIVDLVRNDLGKVCKIGSVKVPNLLAVETYSTVHQLVSTITGKLKDEISVISAIKAMFPGGSMTGAPKLEAMKIIAEIEQQARGIYSGALGFLSINGTAELNIVIRTIVVTKNQLRFGSGGAILVQSDPENEYQEMLLKVKALIEAIQTL